MVSRAHVHPFSASVWNAARANVASRTYKKKGPTLARPAKSQKGASKATLRNGETAWCRGLTCTQFRPPFGALRGQTSRPEPPKKRLGMSLSAQHYQDQQRARKGRQRAPFETGEQHGVAGSRAPIFGLRLKCCEGKRRVQNLKKKAWNELVGPTLPRPAKSQKGASKGTLRNGETAWCRGLTCTHFRPPFEVLRGQTSRPEPTKKRLGMSLWAQHYQDQQRARKGRQKPPFETGKQHGVAGSRAPIFGLRLEVCEGKRRVQNLEKKGLE